MKASDFGKIREILASNPGDAQLLVESGAIDQETLQKVSVLANLAAHFYDLQKLKTDVLSEVGGHDLKAIEFEPGKYEVSIDFVGNLETSARTFGLENLGIKETDGSYEFGGQTASSIEELDGVQEAVQKFADQIAEDLTQRLEMPGVFYYGYNADMGDGALRLFYAFQEPDLFELQKMGANIKGFEEMAEASFEQIMSALETEGCHEMAKRLHAILREI